jgi:hypothetical protein
MKDQGHMLLMQPLQLLVLMQQVGVLLRCLFGAMALIGVLVKA